jgi:hypothetical protein
MAFARLHHIATDLGDLTFQATTREIADRVPFVRYEQSRSWTTVCRSRDGHDGSESHRPASLLEIGDGCKNLYGLTQIHRTLDSRISRTFL